MPNDNSTLNWYRENLDAFIAGTLDADRYHPPGSHPRMST